MGVNKTRNMKCPCGSGKKFKKCHLFKNEGWVFDEKTYSWSKPEAKVVSMEEAQKILGMDEKQIKAVMSDLEEKQKAQVDPKTVESEDASKVALDAEYKEHQ